MSRGTWKISSRGEGGALRVPRTRTQFLRWLPVPKGKAGLPPKKKIQKRTINLAQFVLGTIFFGYFIDYDKKEKFENCNSKV